jgi:hypothetical protein
MRPTLGEQKWYDSTTDHYPARTGNNSLFSNILSVKFLESIFCTPSQSPELHNRQKTGGLRNFAKNPIRHQFDAISLFLNILPINYLE